MADAPAGFAPPQGPIKLVILPQTRAGLGRAGLRRHLETVHGPMVVSEPEVSGRFVSYVHHYAGDCPAAPVLEGHDAVTIIRFGAFADMVASKTSAAYRDRIAPDEDNFRDLAGSIAMFAQERGVAPGADAAPAKLFVFRTAAEADLDGWAQALSAIAARADVQGITTNLARPAEGEFAFVQLDEIGLAADADLPAITASLAALADECLPAPFETRLLLTEPVRFI